MKPMIALTIKQPWAWAFFADSENRKDVENRRWRTNYRGRGYIHAGSK